MMTRLIFSVLILSFASYQSNAQEQKYISFVRMDENLNHSKKIYISTSKLDIQLDSVEIKLLRHDLETHNKPMTKEIYQAYINTRYLCLVTDPTTYQAIVKFIGNNTTLYNNDGVKGSEIYNEVEIHVNNNFFFILNDNSKTFFEKLRAVLQSKKYDQNVHNALGGI